ncbi:MAG TPA: formate--tetrahydrofolate ligase [Bacilli bacterium]|nr:formate--tetrahydrofolate ligase [Bacilli bacterium]
MKLLPIGDIAKKIGVLKRHLLPYGHYKAKIDTAIFDDLKDVPYGKLVLVSAITPTKAGEGKTTTSIALVDGLARLKKRAVLALREPSLGPVFGLKGGATGGGLSRVEPAEEINLHFTGDIHCLTSAVNLTAAIIDNHIFQGNELGIDPNRIVWKRVMDMNDRALREVTVAQGTNNGTPRVDHFMITVASELMAILCLADNPDDFERMTNEVIVAYTYEDKPVRIKDLKISHAIMKLMREAFKPNLVQTLEGNPALIHGGPFANIAHGCNSITATKLGLKLGEILVTEAGFGSDLGAEKFMDIKCRIGGLKPDAAVIVATIRALKMHGGVTLDQLAHENVPALLSGTDNLAKHVSNMKKFGVPSVIALNRFSTDTEAEVEALLKWAQEQGHHIAISDAFAKGGEGAIALAAKVIELIETKRSDYRPLYSLDLPIEEKIAKICKDIYGASGVDFSEKAKSQIAKYRELGYDSLPICMAKTPQSLTDNPDILNAPTNFRIHIREVDLSAGAGFIIPLTGDVMTMPGLGKVPGAVKMQDEPW